ncbi:MAG: aldo/keto reductase [Treponema sp.]|nr:aldo/keto reductase [Treponema sp.]
MEYVRLGKTNLLISRVAFGSMRLSEDGSDDAAVLVRKAYEAGINLFDTSRNSPDSEKLLGDVLYDIRRNVILSSATSAKTVAEIRSNLEESLMTLHCDYIDLYQYECEKFVPLAGGADHIYDTLLELKKQGKIKHIGLVTKNYDAAVKAVNSGLYETIQFPFNVITTDENLSIVKICEEKDIGFIAMQPLGGGVIENLPLAMGFLQQYENVVPVWGVQNQDNLEQILYFNEHPPVIDEKLQEDADYLRKFFN